MTDRTTTWRQILKKHRGDLRKWLRATERDDRALTTIALQLGSYIISRIDRVRLEWPEAPIEFWNRIPDVHACCSDLETFRKPFAVEAYAYVHFLERYRRTWVTLDKLTEFAVLPLASRGVRVLDVGTGPACSLYAIDDFYAAVTEFAGLSDIPELGVEAPELSCVEKTDQMVWFFHEFSERLGRRGPFGCISGEFATLDLREMRSFHRRQNEYDRYWDEETQQYEELYDPVTADAEAERLYRYRLVVLSKFLTAEGDVARFRGSLLELFSDLKAGGVVVVLGATGDNYQRIYDGVAAIARDAGLGDPTWQIDKKTHLGRTDASARIIKAAQYRVYQYLAEGVGEDRLLRTAAYPDYWTPEPSEKARPKFAFRVFRAGRWPIRGSA